MCRLPPSPPRPLAERLTAHAVRRSAATSGKPATRVARPFAGWPALRLSLPCAAFAAGLSLRRPTAAMPVDVCEEDARRRSVPRPGWHWRPSAAVWRRLPPRAHRVVQMLLSLLLLAARLGTASAQGRVAWCVVLVAVRIDATAHTCQRARDDQASAFRFSLHLALAGSTPAEEGHGVPPAHATRTRTCRPRLRSPVVAPSTQTQYIIRYFTVSTIT